MNEKNKLPEFRFYYFTKNYEETVLFYKKIFEVMRSWDRGGFDKGTIFFSPNGTGLIEIEPGEEDASLQGGLYIEVEDVDHWHERVAGKGIAITQPVTNTSYGHRSFKFKDPSGLIIGLFKYLN